MGLRLRNTLAAWGLIALGVAVYALSPFNQVQMATVHALGGWVFSGRDALLAAALLYALAVALVAWRQADAGPSKSLRALGVLVRALRAPAATWRAGLLADDRVAVLTTLLKLFFAPLMVTSLTGFSMAAWANGQALWAQAGQAPWTLLFDRHGFWFLMQAILFVDVACFTLGYLVETPRLGNVIRSVDPSWLGWAVTLACYPPFNAVTSRIVGSPVSDFPRFDDPTVHLALNLALLALMALYTWASLALGWKASNLTHRGIVARGPYAWVRHPAYTCKNLAWWIGAVPLVLASFQQGTGTGLVAAGSMAAWSFLYVLRALTEEDHLRRVDGDYAAYAARVRHRFIPGVV